MSLKNKNPNLLKIINALLLIFYLFALSGCGSSGSGQAAVISVCEMNSFGNTTVSGSVTFDRVFHTNNALDYNKTIPQAVRGAVVEIICEADGLTLASSITNSVGRYNVSLPNDEKNIFVRVKAQMNNKGVPSWDFTVVDNTQGKALYVLDGSPFDLKVDPAIRNLHAPSGWGGSSYASIRAAAPFAILDSVYDAYHKVLFVDPDAVFPPLKLNWSKNNKTISGDLSLGEIGSSSFNGSEIYLLGAENNDTDEYDDHVVIHEFGHYIEEKFSRSDSLGGEHFQAGYLDIRVAFSEGFASAFAGMVNDDPVYRDSSGPNQGEGFSFNVENNNCYTKGWFSECSVQSIIYDLYDNANDSVDIVGFGFTPLFDVLVNEQKNTSAMVSIFSFIDLLKQNNPAERFGINALVSGQNIGVITDVYGDSETSNNPGSSSVLPVHEHIEINGDSVEVCSTDDFQAYNGLGVYRLLRFTMSAPQLLTIKAIKTTGSGKDPDIYLYQKGRIVGVAESKVVNNETLHTPLLDTGKTYVIEVYEYENIMGGVGTTCFNVNVST